MLSRLLMLCTVSMMMGGCALFQAAPKQRSLVDVVDAVQYAVEELARENLWEATAVEQAHWANACKLAREEASKKCVQTLPVADRLCRQSCPSGNCGLVHSEICRKLSTGEDRIGLCEGIFKNSEWCPKMESCALANRSSTEVCEAANSIGVPTLKQAAVTLAVENSVENSGSLNVLVVSFGGNSSRIAANTVTVQLLPRVRSTQYGSDVLPPLPANKQISSEVANFAKELKEILRNTVTSVVKERSDDGDSSIAKPPMALGNFDVQVSLVIQQQGSLGIEKAWSNFDAGLKLGTQGKAVHSNVLTISYAR